MWPLVFDTIARIIPNSGKFDFSDSDLLVNLIKVTEDSVVAASYVKQFIDADIESDYYSTQELECIFLSTITQAMLGLLPKNQSAGY